MNKFHIFRNEERLASVRQGPVAIGYTHTADAARAWHDDHLSTANARQSAGLAFGSPRPPTSSQIFTPFVSFNKRLPTIKVMDATMIG